MTQNVLLEKDIWQHIKHDFKNIPLKNRPNPLWFWNDTSVDTAELKKQIRDFKLAGYGGLSILPFGKNFKPEYLTEDYFKVYRFCVEEAQRQGLSLWLYDEYGFPSGTAGDINGDGIGRFKQKYPEFTNKRLDKIEYMVKGGEMLEQALPLTPLMAAVAMNVRTRERINLRTCIFGDTLRWLPPFGKWKVMIFTCINAGNTLVDYMSPEAVNAFIAMTHEAYYQRLAPWFGNTIMGTFFDEPTLYYAEGRSWTPDFNRKFREKYGIAPDLYYPALWYDIGKETAEARDYLFGFRATLYAEGYPKLVSEWSKTHGIHATGHQDNEEIINCTGTSGDLMKCFKYQDIPGIDKIGGDRPAEHFYKIVSSAARLWDHPFVMSETFGAMGNISWNTLYGIAMNQYAKGINLLIPHAVWYDTAKVYFLPELSTRNPLYADTLPIFNDYLARLNLLLQNEGQWQGNIAVLYPIHTLQCEHYMDGPLGYYRGGVEIQGMNYTRIGVELFDSLGMDFLFIHPEILDEHCSIKNGNLCLKTKSYENTFHTFIVPASTTISLSNLQKMQQFVRAGGMLILVGQTPSKATRTSENSKVKKGMAQLKKQSRVFCINHPSDLKTCLAQNSSSIFKTKQTVPHLHKIYEGKNIWFFANSEPAQKNVEVELNGRFAIEIWDPHTGQVSSIRTLDISGNKTRFQLHFNGVQSLFVIEK
jgi:hypothetical protein